MVGDSPSDVEFGIQLGMRTIFVQPSAHSTPAELSDSPPDFILSGLSELAGSLPEDQY
jgi:phosphoglycolate phosphatase-like HAD superfamily hydrolase